MFDTEYDPSGKSNLSFQVGTEILNLLLLYASQRHFLLGSLGLGLSARFICLTIFSAHKDCFYFLNSFDQIIINCFG